MLVIGTMGFLVLFIGVMFLRESYQKRNDANYKKNITIGIVLITVGIIAFGAYLATSMSSGSSSSSKGDRWDSLSKEEKQWYERNYGGGKSEQYRKAIDDYKSSH